MVSSQIFIDLVKFGKCVVCWRPPQFYQWFIEGNYACSIISCKL